VKRTAITIAAIVAAAAFVLHRAEAAPAAQEPAFIASVDGVSMYAVNANGLRCIVTAPQGAISCK